ncbi:MAG: phage portal protein [Bacteroidetes bacterium]|nr:phage portal protein [Bacteroidota bacterium]
MFERLKQRISGFFDTPNASPEKKGGVRHQPRPHFIQRSIDANSRAPRTQDFGRLNEINSEINAANENVRQRARYLALNDPHVANGLDTFVAEATGTGARPSPSGDDGQPEIIERFEAWGETCGHDGENWPGIQAMAALDLKRDGETLWLINDTPAGLKLQHLDVARIDTSKTSFHHDRNENFVNSGVEFDKSGQITAYWIRQYLDQFDVWNHAGLGSPHTIRIPARQVIHVVDRKFAGQVRGLSSLACIILPANDLAALMDASRMAAKMSSMIAAFVRNPEAQAIDLGDLDNAEFLPGSILNIGNYEIEFSNPQGTQNIDRYISIHLRQIASGLGMPSWMIDNLFERINYSSSRSGLIPFRRRVEQWRETTLLPQFHNRIWNRWAGMEFLQGNTRTVMPGAGWIWPAWENVDPLKSVQAVVSQIEAGILDRETAIRMLHGSNAERIIGNLNGEIDGTRYQPSHLNLIPGGR